jgi:iron(II)-dependent oxidoreductase
VPTAQANLTERIAERLAETRERTLMLVEPLSEEELNRVYSPLLSPLAWDLGHIANFEELWLVQRIGDREPLRGELGQFYDAIENPRKTRNELPILRGDDLRAYMAEVRERTLEVLDEVELEETDDRLLRDGFVYELILAHEQQHNETMLQLSQMVDGYELPELGFEHATEVSDGPEMVRVDGGSHEIGAPADGFAYDNERPRHAVELEPFEIDRTPVTNAAFAAFVEETGTRPPLYWKRHGDGWLDTRFGRREPVGAGEPVIHVDFEQASGFARWAGKRLPTEFEWEAASACNAVQMVGHVWEWTSSDFEAYPGFEAFPYREYSEAFFGDGYKVLRGGAWATSRDLIRPSFRNWDLPQRSQIFSGLRCVREV